MGGESTPYTSYQEKELIKLICRRMQIMEGALPLERQRATGVRERLTSLAAQPALQGLAAGGGNGGAGAACMPQEVAVVRVERRRVQARMEALAKLAIEDSRSDELRQTMHLHYKAERAQRSTSAALARTQQLLPVLDSGRRQFTLEPRYIGGVLAKRVASLHEAEQAVTEGLARVQECHQEIDAIFQRCLGQDFPFFPAALQPPARPRPPAPAPAVAPVAVAVAVPAAVPPPQQQQALVQQQPAQQQQQQQQQQRGAEQQQQQRGAEQGQEQEEEPRRRRRSKRPLRPLRPRRFPQQ